MVHLMQSKGNDIKESIEGNMYHLINDTYTLSVMRKIDTNRAVINNIDDIYIPRFVSGMIREIRSHIYEQH